MNRNDAAAILNVDPAASPEEARRAYQELFTEHQVRLTNAPTPALRSLYQARLLELDDARDALLAPEFGDANSDLPTDQPSIPSHQGGEPQSTQRTQPPLPADRTVTVDQSKSSRQEAAAKGTIPPNVTERVRRAPATRIRVIVAGILIFIGIGGFLFYRTRQHDIAVQKAQAATLARQANQDSLPPLRDDITIARVEFDRGDYDAANKALGEADRHYAALPAGAAGDTAFSHLKEQLDQLHSKVVRACEALKKVAEHHPGEPTCKTL